MTDDEIGILAARLTGFGGIVELHYDECIEFARAIEARVRAEERERCAKIAERHYIAGHSVAGPAFAAICAAAIRALKEKP
jgi:hypothetical protein